MKKGLFLIISIALLSCIFALASAEEVVIVDNNDVCIRVKSAETSGDNFEMKLYLENKSNVTAMFSIEDTVVNGYVAEPFWANEIGPGKKANSTVRISNLSSHGITEIVNSIMFTMRVYDSNDWSADDLFKDRFVLFPTGEKNAHITERAPKSTDITIVDNDKISIIVTGFGEDRIWGYIANTYLVNKTNKTLMFSADDGYINGFSMEPFWATELPPKSRSYSNISWSNSSFEENDITSVDEIELTFRVYDSDDWMADDVYKDTVTLHP